jgi:uncharacterized protein (DUF302 family)
MTRFGILQVAAVSAVLFVADAGSAADSGLITKSSNYSAAETVQRFEKAISEKGWIVFTEVDHAAAAAKIGQTMRPRTVILFGNPKIGTAPMQRAATLAIDNPPKALVWEDELGKVSLTYNSADYIANHIYLRHGLTMPAENRAALDRLLDTITDQATK